MHGVATAAQQATRPRTALHGLRIGLPAGVAAWSLIVALLRRLRRR